MSTESELDFEILACSSDPLDMHLHATKIADPAMLQAAFVTGGRFVGTDDSEVWSIEQLVKLLKSSDGTGWQMNLVSERKLMSLSDNAMTFLEFLSHTTYGRMRGSGVVVRGVDGKWRILDYVLSFSVPNEVVPEGSLVAFIREQL